MRSKPRASWAKSSCRCSMCWATLGSSTGSLFRIFATNQFPDPERRKDRNASQNHLGMHLTVLQGLVRSPMFDNFFRDLVQVANSVLSERLAYDKEHPSEPCIPTFCFFCRKGRHRSVGIATIFANFLADSGWRVDVAHLMQSYWRLETCGECEECRSRDDEKMRIICSPWT